MRDAVKLDDEMAGPLGFTSWDARTGVHIDMRGDDASIVFHGFHVNRDPGDEDPRSFHVSRAEDEVELPPSRLITIAQWEGRNTTEDAVRGILGWGIADCRPSDHERLELK